jgi:CubicO group peptidase (beta-lactamase class C family)
MDKRQRIIRRLRIIMPLVGLVCAIIIPPWDIFIPWMAPLPDTVQAEVDGALDQGLDGIVVLVDRAGEEPAFYAAGWKDKGAEAPADPDALFKIGSITKLYVAAAVAKLAHEGTLPLDSTLADYLPELVGRIEHADEITVRMLVQHRSGIPNYSDDEAWDWLAPAADEDASLALILDDPADFPPDARYRYSNTNYLLLGRILDQVLDYDYTRYIRSEILDPLGLTDTYFALDEVALDDLASGYWYGYGDDLKGVRGGRNTAGSMIATARDVAIFLRALNDGSLLSDEEQAVYSSIYEYGHTGWVPGYYSIARYHEDIDAVVVLFASNTGGETWGLATVTGGKATGISNAIYGRIMRILRRLAAGATAPGNGRTVVL